MSVCEKVKSTDCESTHCKSTDGQLSEVPVKVGSNDSFKKRWSLFSDRKIVHKRKKILNSRFNKFKSKVINRGFRGR